MPSARSVLLKESDRDKIQSLLYRVDDDNSLLFEELDEATVLADHQFPKDVVAMHSYVTFVDLDKGGESKVQLVYPHEADVAAQRISIFAPIGSALIGLRVGEKIAWPLPGHHERRIEVVAVEDIE